MQSASSALPLPQPTLLKPSVAPEVDDGTGPQTGHRPDQHTLAAPVPPKARPSRHREMIPGYEIVKEIGRGGMGVVYKARQHGLNRLVAVKMLLAGTHAGKEDLDRFRIEAEAVARLEHPNIVHIYDIGEVDGRPYFSLEFVDGGSLAQKISSNPQPARIAAEIMETLARAMHYAHECGIIHRDLKPANILLQRRTTIQYKSSPGDTSKVQPAISDVQSEGDDPPLSVANYIVKITDFGLAKRIDGDSSQTRTGTILGTPSYMPPEQAEGRMKELGPAADIYSLGAVLYDLITGRPPFRGETLLDTLDQVRTTDVVPLTRLLPKTPRDLDTICLKCLEKEAGKRYATALELADELRRFLHGEPVRARRARTWERAWKWARRRPAAAALAGLSFFLLLSLALGGPWMARHEYKQRLEAERLQGLAEEQERIAKGENARANQNFEQAERNLQHALDAVDQMLTRVGEERLAHEPRMERVRRDLYRKARDFYELLVRADNANPDFRGDTGLAYARVGDMEERLGQPREAEKAYRDAVRIFTELPAELRERPRYRRSLAACYNNLGILLHAADRRAEAEDAYRQALDLKKGLAAQSSEPATQLDLARTQNNWGLLMQTGGRSHEAGEAFQEAVQSLEQLSALVPGQADVEHELARGYLHQGTLWQTTGNAQNAEKAYLNAMARLSPLAARFRDDPDYRQELAETQQTLGVLLHKKGRVQDAEAAYAEAGRLAAELHHQYPAIPEYHLLQAIVAKSRGTLLRDKTPRYPEAEKALQEAVAILATLSAEIRTVPLYRLELARTYNEQAILLDRMKRSSDAEKSFQQAIATQKELAADFPRDSVYPQDLAKTYLNLGILLAGRKPPLGAEETLRKAVKLAEDLDTNAVPDPQNWELLVSVYYNLSALLDAQGSGPVHVEQAWRRMAAALVKLVEAAPKNLNHQHDLALTLDDLGRLMQQSGEFDKARHDWEAAVRAHRAAMTLAPQRAAYKQELCAAYLALGETLVQLKDHAAAADRIAELEPVIPSGWPNRPRAAVVLAQCVELANKDRQLGDSQRRERAERYGEQAVRLLRQALAEGYKDRSFLRNDPGLGPLRKRADFASLLSEPAKKAAK